MRFDKIIFSLIMNLCIILSFPFMVSAQETQNSQTQTIDLSDEIENPSTTLNVYEGSLLQIPDNLPNKFTYDNEMDIPYPEDGVKGIYLTSNTVAGPKMQELTDLVNDTALNSMVIDVKEDYGSVTMPLNTDNEMIKNSTEEVVEDPEGLMTHFEENDIYPIARIVVFKDSRLAKQRPDLSFTEANGEVWQNSAGESFVNPFQKEVWDYNIEIAKEAAKLGFKEIQFDYVRFPEGFETMDDQLNYSQGNYQNSDLNNVQRRVQAVTEFVDYAHKELAPYGVDVSVDIFGYTAMVQEAPGIGQSFPKIASNVDVISSMIYPSHWGPGNLGVAKPDLKPYKTINNYIQMELGVLKDLNNEAPTTRPWLQDFTASYLGTGNYREYGSQEVSAQIKALHDNGVHEYLLWDSSNEYSFDTQYSFE